MFQIKSDSKGSYFYRRSKPVVTLNDMIETIEYFENGLNLPQNIRILEDTRDVSLKFSIQEIPAIIKKASKVAEKYQLVKHAIIYNSPVYTAYGLLAENLLSNKSYFIKAFSSEKAARDWLEIDDIIS
ncbi:MAG: hypothetical protein Q8T08_09880 [Ignavibacteria bacterium]|jgi:hypothetical protein|nr:hypothetical protein [Ignavibacteria bacterium]